MQHFINALLPIELDYTEENGRYWAYFRPIGTLPWIAGGWSDCDPQAALRVAEKSARKWAAEQRG